MKIFIVATLLAMAGFLLLNNNLNYSIIFSHYLKILGEKNSVRKRLAKLGRDSEYEYENFRIKQLFFLTIFLLVLLLFSIIYSFSPVLFLILLGSGTCAIFLISERDLDGRAKKFQRVIESEFPSVIEMLTLALSAGESPLSAMKRISERGSGYLAQEFARVVSASHGGVPFADALEGMGRKLDSHIIRKFIDALIIAITRGAPLVDVLQRHAQEAREAERNHILNSAGKAEISMMIPVVFLILPISILFALWPSLTNLNYFAS